MLLTRHYEQRPLNETVCNALIANGDVKKPSKRCKKFTMEDALNMVHILVACVMEAYGLVQLTVCDEEQQKKWAARWRCVRYTTYGLLG